MVAVRLCIFLLLLFPARYVASSIVDFGCWLITTKSLYCGGEPMGAVVLFSTVLIAVLYLWVLERISVTSGGSRHWKYLLLISFSLFVVLLGIAVNPK
jgi:hypothetical protein